MPELPEVETVVRTLENKISGAKIKVVNLRYPRLVDNCSKEEFIEKLVGQEFKTFNRRGKYIIFGLTDYNLVSHLRMEGKYYVEPNLDIVNKHTHLIIEFTDNRYLMYNDVRKFGRIQLYRKGEELLSLKNVGIEPFSTDLTINYLKKKSSPKKPIKVILLDQSIIAGIGNIYANEICFAIHRKPDTLFGNLSDQELEELIKETRRILAEAIKLGGTTIRSYTSSLGVSGKFQQDLMVHGREKEKCKICGTTIIKTRIDGRGTYYCPCCQK